MSISFFILAAISNAFMDVILWHFDKSIVSNLPKEWWNPNYSWMNVKPILGVRPDAWHLAKYGMLVSLIGSIATYKPILGYWDVVIYFIVWWITFELFYSKIFRK